MSSTSLMAWVARYMTERFSSRSRSQPAAASGALSTREPSSDGMLLRWPTGRPDCSSPADRPVR